MKFSIQRLRGSGLAELYQRYRQIFLSLILGFACLFVLMYSNNMLRRETARRFHSLGTDLFSIIDRHGHVTRGAAQLRPLQHALLDVLKRDPSYVFEVAPEAYRLQKVRFQEVESAAPTIGIFAGYHTVFDLQMQHGRFFSYLDSTGSFCILGNRLWEKWRRHSADSLIGHSVQIGRQVCTVIGVLEPSPTFSGEYRLDDAILLPFYTMIQFSNNRNFTKVTLRANPAHKITEVVDYIQARLTQLLGDLSVYEISNQALFAKTVSQRMKYLSMVTGSLGSIALLFAAWQLLFSLRLEKRSAQDVKTRVPVARYNLKTAIKIGLLSSLTGALIGQVIAWLISHFNQWVWQFSIWPFFLTLLFGCLITGLVGWRVDSERLTDESMEKAQA